MIHSKLALGNSIKYNSMELNWKGKKSDLQFEITHGTRFTYNLRQIQVN